MSLFCKDCITHAPETGAIHRLHFRRRFFLYDISLEWKFVHGADNKRGWKRRRRSIRDL